MSGHKRGRCERSEESMLCGTCMCIPLFTIHGAAFDGKYCSLGALVTCTAHVFLPCYRLYFISLSPLSISIISRNYSPPPFPEDKGSFICSHYPALNSSSYFATSTAGVL